ncbi:MAG TPA: hypothetical protein VEK15_01940 [Vicinamibacteria bacterium]|nr:hypothetical protein [Vicinamibacteria bacterium]
MYRPTWTFPISGLALLGGLACESSSSPSSPSITAPAIQAPAVGAVVTEELPTLTVRNASGGQGEPTYRFEVATDDRFQSMVAEVEGVGEGPGDTTSWQLPEPPSGAEADAQGLSVYFWRARASATGEVGPWSETASFKMQEGFSVSAPSSAGIFVSDPLTNGTSVGMVSGGTFNARGWMATAADTFIRYEVPTIVSGFVEFDVTNLREPNPRSDKRMLMIMWDPTRGEYTTNPYRMHLQKLDGRTVDFGHLRLRWISRRQERNIYYDYDRWNPDQVYHFRVEWGDFPGIDTQWGRGLFDGVEILTWNYDNPYDPSTHWIELGGAPRNETLEQAIFSNVRIGKR